MGRWERPLTYAALALAVGIALAQSLPDRKYVLQTQRYDVKSGEPVDYPVTVSDELLSEHDCVDALWSMGPKPIAYDREHPGGYYFLFACVLVSPEREEKSS